MGRRRHEGREDLAGEHRLTDGGQIILLFIFLIVWVLDSFVFRYSTFPTKYVPIFIRIPIAIVFFFFSGFLARVGLRIVFGEQREKPSVVRKSVFGVVRHPVYLSCILFYLAMLILTLSILSGTVWIVIIVFYHLVSRYEERLLLQKFGEEYEGYMKEVPMWIPRIIKKRK
jgi:protein-S-isoprenylcysteine O-methyltransferase Ste14